LTQPEQFPEVIPIELFVAPDGHPHPWSLDGTLHSHPAPSTTLYWKFEDNAHSLLPSHGSMTQHQQGGLLFLFSFMVALMWIATEVPFIAQALTAIWSQRHLFTEGAGKVVEGAKYLYDYVSPFGKDVAQVVSSGAETVMNAGETVVQAATPVVNDIGGFAEDAGKEIVNAGEGVVQAATPVVGKIGDYAQEAGKEIADGAKTVVDEIKKNGGKMDGGTSHRTLKNSALVPLTIIDGESTNSVFFGLVGKQRGQWCCAAMLAMPASAFESYPPDFYLNQNLLRLTKLVNTVMGRDYKTFCENSVKHLPTKQRSIVKKELQRMGKRIKSVVKKHNLPIPLPDLASPQQLLYKACCNPVTNKKSADCKGYMTLYKDTLKRSGWLTAKSDVRCELLRPKRTRKKIKV